MCTLSRYEQNCKILFLFKQGESKRYLLHEKNNRYSEKNVPVGEKFNIYTSIINGGTINIEVSVVLPWHVENIKQHPLTWLRSKEKIPCNGVKIYNLSLKRKPL